MKSDKKKNKVTFQIRCICKSLASKGFNLQVISVPEESDLAEFKLCDPEKPENNYQFATPSEFKKKISKAGGNGWQLHFVHDKTGCLLNNIRGVLEDLVVKYSNGEIILDESQKTYKIEVDTYKNRNIKASIDVKTSFLTQFYEGKSTNKRKLKETSGTKIEKKEQEPNKRVNFFKEKNIESEKERIEKERILEEQVSIEKLPSQENCNQENTEELLKGHIGLFFPLGKESECDYAIPMALFNVQKSIVSNLQNLDFFVKMVGEVYSFDCIQPKLEEEEQQFDDNPFYEEEEQVEQDNSNIDEEKMDINEKEGVEDNQDEKWQNFPVTKIINGRNVLIYDSDEEGEEDDIEFDVSNKYEDNDKCNGEVEEIKEDDDDETDQMFNVNFELLSDFNKKTKNLDMFDMKIPTFIKVDCSSLTVDKKKLKGAEELTTLVKYFIKPRSDDDIFAIFASHLNRTVLMGINKKRENNGLERYVWKDLDVLAKPLRFSKMLQHYKTYIKSLVEKCEKSGEHQKKMFFYSYMEIIELFEENFFLDVADMGKDFWEKFTENTTKIQQKTIQIFGIKLNMINEKIVSKEKNKNSLINVFKNTMQTTAYSLCKNDYQSENDNFISKNNQNDSVFSKIKRWAKSEIDDIFKEILHFLNLDEESSTKSFAILEKRIGSFFSLLIEKRKTMTDECINSITKSILHRVTSNDLCDLSNPQMFSSLFLMISSLCNSLSQIKNDTAVILEKETTLRNIKTLYHPSTNNSLDMYKNAIENKIKNDYEREKKLLVDSYEGKLMMEKSLRMNNENQLLSLRIENDELKKNLRMLQIKSKKKKILINNLENENKRNQIMKNLVQKIATEQGISKTLLDDFYEGGQSKRVTPSENNTNISKESEQSKKSAFVEESVNGDNDSFFNDLKIGENQQAKQKEVKKWFN